MCCVLAEKKLSLEVNQGATPSPGPHPAALGVSGPREVLKRSQVGRDRVRGQALEIPKSSDRANPATGTSGGPSPSGRPPRPRSLRPSVARDDVPSRGAARAPALSQGTEDALDSFIINTMHNIRLTKNSKTGSS